MPGVNDAVIIMNSLGALGRPFLFAFNYELSDAVVLALDEINPDEILYNFSGVTNASAGPGVFSGPVMLDASPADFRDYLSAFRRVQREIMAGNTYLCNLTFSTSVLLNTAPAMIFQSLRSRYNLWMRGKFLCFSPECFVKIQQNTISSYPMKGTADAGLPGAEEKLMADPKEIAEHHTIVDLIRNDIGRVAEDISVKRFRYIDLVQTNRKNLLQVSSEISGRLSGDWPGRLGDIITGMLPAGSISGAPKKRTMEIIASAETGSRGWFTGIAGIFDGKSVDSCVLIRFIEERDGKYFYRSGGGITQFSDVSREYNEMTDKIYVPVF